MFKINVKDFDEYEAHLKTFAKRAYPFATKATINKAAFETRKEAQGIIRANMTTRNAFTVKSIRVEQSRTLVVDHQAATVGSIAPYMAVQEFGGIKGKKGSEGVAIATSYSSGEGENARPRTKLPRKPNKLANIRLQRRAKGGASRKQKNAAAIRAAAESGSKYVFLDLGRTKGIFKVIGGKRRPKIKMVYSLTHQSVAIPKNPWLAPAVAKTEKKIPQYYTEALGFQLERRGLFR